MATTVETLVIKSADEIRDDYLRTYRNALIKRGVPDPNVGEGTEIFARATAIAQQTAVISANVPLAANAQMPDTAQGDDLIRLAQMRGLSLRPAGPSAGAITLAATIATAIAIPTGAQLIDSNGLTYQVSVGGAYVNGTSVPMVSVATGDETNLAAGAVLRWTAPPPFVKTTALVAAGGLTGGVDEEDPEALRGRLLESLRAPPNGSNWPFLAGVAESSSTAVEKAFPYPAANGPSTMHVAVVRAPTATNKNRDVNALVLAQTIRPAVQAEMVEYADLLVTTVANVAVTVSVGLTLPDSTKAVPPGPGGGWLDANPFPQDASGKVPVTAVTSSTVFTVSSDLMAPIAGDTVCWVSPSDWKLRSAKIVSFTGAGPSYVLTIDTPFVSDTGVVVAVNNLIFPGAERAAAYVDAALSAFAAMGPGEKTDLVTLLPRARRRPLISSGAWPSELKNAFLRKITEAGAEVASASYLFRSVTTPAVSTLITDPPNILVPGTIGFYPG